MTGQVYSLLVAKRIVSSSELACSLDLEIDGLAIPGDERSRLAAGCFDLAREHHQAVANLLAQHLIASAYSLVRVQYEAYVRGVWLAHFATSNDLSDLADRVVCKKLDKMVREIESEPKMFDGWLAKVQALHNASLADYVHSGMRAIVRRNSEGGIQPVYDDDEMIGVLEFTDIIGTFAARHIALMASRYDLAEKFCRLGVAAAEGRKDR